MTVHVVALGDSLTAGYQASDAWSESVYYTPYTEFLAELVRQPVRFTNLGIDGDMTRGMAERFVRDVVPLAPDIVIVMGGTNDLGYGLADSSIIATLERIYQGIHEIRAYPVACTVPPIRGWEDAIPRVAHLSSQIMSLALEQGVPFADVFKGLAGPGSQVLPPELSSDGIHLSTLGYRRVASIIYGEVLGPVFGL